MIYYKHFTRKLMLRYFFSSVLWHGFQECSLSGEVIKNLPLPFDKSSYRSNFLKPIFQSINQIWVKYLKIKVRMESYECFQSAKKIKESCQVFSPWVDVHLCYKWPPLLKARWEKPVTLPLVWRKNYTSFQSSEKLAVVLLAQSVYKKMFTYSYPGVQETAAVNTRGRENDFSDVHLVPGWAWMLL